MPRIARGVRESAIERTAFNGAGLDGLALRGGMDLANLPTTKRPIEPRKKEDSAMAFLWEVDVDEFLELMECETEARLRVAEIMARRRRTSASELGRGDEPKTAH
jgi:hypothetical protein